LKILIYYKIKIKCEGAELLPYLHVIKLKHMKIVNGIISVLLGVLALYLMFTAKSNLDLTCMFIVLMGAIVFICFMIIEEQKEEIERLRQNMWDQKWIKDNKRNIEITTDSKGIKWFRDIKPSRF